MDEYNIYEGAWSGPAIDQAIGRVYASGNSGALASAADLTNIQATSPTNTTGSAISSGTYFYLDGTLVRAKANIASGATFTSSNYETVTAGGLNDLKAAIEAANVTSNILSNDNTVQSNSSTAYKIEKLVVANFAFKPIAGTYIQNDIFLSGFPAPPSGFSIRLMGNDGSYLKITLDQYGRIIKDETQAVANTWFVGQISYISA